MTILVIAEHDNSSLAKATFNVVTAAKQMDDDIHVLVAGNNCSSVIDQASKLRYVSKVKSVEAPHYADHTIENLGHLIIQIAHAYTHILLPATCFGKGLAPRLAACLDVAQISEITAVVSSDTYVRPIYAGNALATVKTLDKIQVITVRSTAFDPVEVDGNACIEQIPAAEDTLMSRLINRQLSNSTRPELSSAKIVVSGGRGLGSDSNFRLLLEPLADALSGALGASRAAVDAGFAPNEIQVGQTGKIVAPQLYIAVGISGAIQHLAGMKDSKTIVAINKDPDAPIFQVADYGLVADLFDAVPKLIDQLQ